MRSILAFLVVAVAGLCAGCASVTQGTSHPLRIDTLSDKGEQVDGATCTARNDRMNTSFLSGGSIEVRRSNVDLVVSCTATGQPEATGRLVSRVNAGLAGNILLGGAIGAAVDHSSGAAYTYPGWVRLVFGQTNVYDRDKDVEGLAMTPPGVAVVPRRLPEPARAAPQGPVLAGREARQTYEYKLTDRRSGRQQSVVLQVERTVDGELTFNNGARVETTDGRLVRLTSALAGELDQVTPPGGWFQEGRTTSSQWKTRHRSVVPASNFRYELDAYVQEERQFRVGDRDLRVVQVLLRGWIENHGGLTPARARYEGAVWLAPELRRVVRFEARARAPSNLSGYFDIDEVIELVRIGPD